MNLSAKLVKENPAAIDAIQMKDVEVTCVRLMDGNALMG